MNTKVRRFIAAPVAVMALTAGIVAVTTATEAVVGTEQVAQAATGDTWDCVASYAAFGIGIAASALVPREAGVVAKLITWGGLALAALQVAKACEDKLRSLFGRRMDCVKWYWRTVEKEVWPFGTVQERQYRRPCGFALDAGGNIINPT